MIDRNYAGKLIKNPAFVCGSALLLLGSGPFFVALVLDAVGLIDAGTGLGLALLMYATLPPGLVLMIVGAEIVARRSRPR